MSKKYKKYVYQKSAIIIGSILVALFFLIYIAMLVVINTNDLNATLLSSLTLIKEISLVGFTVFGSTLVASLFIDVKNKNKQYITTIANEIIADPRFVSILDEESINSLNQAILGGNKARQEMLSFLFNNIKSEKYYFTDCNLDIKCRNVGDKIEKTIIKRMTMFSFDKKTSLDNYKLVGIAGKENYESSNNFQIKYIKINGNKIDSSEFKITYEKVEMDLYGLLHNKYQYRCRCFLINPLNLSSSKATTIEMEYVSFVSKDDLKYVSRVTAPCKKFEINFVMENTETYEYDVSGTAFGFMDNNLRFPNISQNIFKAKFDDWTFKDDGVSINIIEHKK